MFRIDHTLVKRFRTLGLFWLLVIPAALPLIAQQLPDPVPFYTTNPVQRAYDSLVASRIPPVQIPPGGLKTSLPVSVDNSTYPWFPGILSQYSFFSCQQYSGCGFTFTYEINRLRDANGLQPANRYASHYTWNFFNLGGQYEGVNFLHSFHAMMEQGHMTNADWGHDTAHLFTGWADGYDKYHRAMYNRLRTVRSIAINSAEGIQTLKQYLVDHLDGSSSGGVAAFTASSPNVTTFFPEGTPEAGKAVILEWLPYSSHGMAIVGYNDSVRYDLNGDGQYTNHLDITGDGVVDARDWEYGAFKFANSYGTWWADGGYCYITYHAMACEFGEGGVWNNSVYLLEPDPDYTPLLTMKLTLEHNRRNQISVKAGVNTDVTAEYPEQVIDLSFFANQGGANYMQGFDSLESLRTIELGLDVTPLLNYTEAGQPARFFVIVEENDPSSLGEGKLLDASFLYYGTDVEEFPCEGVGVKLNHNSTTLASATGTPGCQRPEILTDILPPLISGEPYSVQLQAAGGTPPYSWLLRHTFHKASGSLPYEPFTDVQLFPESDIKPFTRVALPFSFPFFGKQYDSAYINAKGLIHFGPDQLPYPYLTSIPDMADYIEAIIPATAYAFVIRTLDGDGMWMRSTPDSVMFRWKLSIWSVESQTNVEFSAILYPDGSIHFCFGPAIIAPYYPVVYSGIGGGHPSTVQLSTFFNLPDESGNSYVYHPVDFPGGINLTPEGILTVTEADSTLIYGIPVRVTDDQGIFSERVLPLADGLLIHSELASASGVLQHGESATLDVILTNNGLLPLTNIRLALSSSPGMITLADSLKEVSLLEPGQTLTLPDCFAFSLSSWVEDQVPVPFLLEATAGGKIREHRFFLTVSAPDLQIASPLVEDGVNGLLEPGEVSHLVFPLSNDGSLNTPNLTATLESQDPKLEILSSATLQLDPVNPNTMTPLTFLVKAARSADAGHQAPISLTVTDGNTIQEQYQGFLQLGISQVAIINLSSSSGSGDAMEEILDDLNVNYDSYTSFPWNMVFYPCVFLNLGTAYSGSHLLTADETAHLHQYLMDGGHAYMESYSSWFYGEKEVLEGLFRFKSERVDVYYFNEAFGMPGTLTEGMHFLYTGPSPYAIFELIPAYDAFSLFRNDDSPAKALQIGYAGEDYKTIASFLEFGKLADTVFPSDKATLFSYYLDFLGVNRSTVHSFFHADVTKTCRWHPVQFTDDSFEGIIIWSWEFPGGTPSVSDQQNPEVVYHDAGFYDVILTVSDGIHSQTLRRREYIQVENCTGTEELSAGLETLKIWPNPASGKVIIDIPAGCAPGGRVDVTDMRGTLYYRSSIEEYHPDNTYTLSVSGWPSGIYMITVSSLKKITSGKLVILN